MNSGLLKYSFETDPVENRKKGNIGNDCLVTVDGTNFCIPHMGRKFYSHKFRASGLQYEIAVLILSGECV